MKLFMYAAGHVLMHCLNVCDGSDGKGRKFAMPASRVTSLVGLGGFMLTTDIRLTPHFLPSVELTATVFR